MMSVNGTVRPFVSHVEAGVPGRRPSSPARGPISSGPSCVSGQRGPVTYGSYEDGVLVILPLKVVCLLLSTFDAKTGQETMCIPVAGGEEHCLAVEHHGVLVLLVGKTLYGYALPTP